MSGFARPETPDDLVALANAFFEPKALLTACRIGVFPALAGGPATAAEVAARLEDGPGEPRAVGLLLRALVAMGLVERVAAGEGAGPDRFALTPLARDALVPGSARYVGDYLALNDFTFEAWSRLERCVRTGRPAVEPFLRSDRAAHRDFIRAMHNTAQGTAPLVAAGVDLRGRRTLVDVGSGPGTFAIHFCRRYPDLRATLVDFAETIPIAREVVAETGADVADRVDYRAGDFHAEALGGPYDAAWLSHIVHGHGEERLAALFAKVHGALAPGGLIALHDFFLEADRTRPAFGAVFALNMLVFTDGGRTYSFEETRALLEGAGFARVEWRKLGEPRGISVVVARRS